MEYRKDIQGLRAIAVLFVWLFHLNSNILPGGFIGVDIFFVVSGFLITSITLIQKENNKFSFAKFYFSRIRRIVPAYYVFLLVISCLTLYLYIPVDIAEYTRRLFYSVIFNSNSYFAGLDNYFGAGSSENPLLHTWTLAIEMQFYLVLPFIIYFFNKKKSLILSIALFILLLSYAQYQISIGNDNLMYFSLLARSPEFLVGVILSLMMSIYQDKLTLNKNIQTVLGVLGVIILIVSAGMISESSKFPGLLAIIPCSGAFLILWNKEGVVNKLLSNKVFVYIGELSYSIYLWHWGFLALMRYNTMSYTLTMTQYLIVIVLTIICSVLSYYLVENTFRRIKMKPFILKFVIIPVLLVGSIFFARLYYIPSQSNNYPEYLTTPKPFGLENYGKYTKDIIQGDMMAKDTLLLIGNSFGLVMKPFIESVGKEYNFCFRSVTNTSYPPIPGISDSIFSNKGEIQKYNMLCDTVLSKSINSKVIIISTTFHKKELMDEYIHALKALQSSLKPDQHIVLLGGFPILADCNNSDVNKDLLRLTKSVYKSISEVKEMDYFFCQPSKELLNFIDGNKNIHYLDFSDSPAFKDAPFYNDTIMYYDRYHINHYGSLKYAEHSGYKLGKLIEEILNSDN